MGPPGGDPIGRCVTRTAKTLSRAFDGALAEGGGSLASWLVLASLKGGLHATQREIAQDVGVEGPTLTHHLNRMEAADLVTRARDPRNRRAHHVELTAAGEQSFRTLLARVQAFDRRLRAGFSNEELATLRRLLERLGNNAVRDDATPSGKPGVATATTGKRKSEQRLAGR
jgi:MarR family transcriptional regulator for hemolysin